MLSKNVPFWSVLDDIFETSGGITSHLGYKVIMGSSVVSQTLTLAGRPFSFELKIIGEKVGYCQSLPSDVLLLGASYSVY